MTPMHPARAPIGASHAVVTSALVVPLLLSGCTDRLRVASAGQTGCLPEEVEISDDHRGWNSRTWKATCQGVAYVCSSISTSAGNDTTTQINCTKMSNSEQTGTGASAVASSGGDRGDLARGFDEAKQEMFVTWKVNTPEGQQLLVRGAPQAAPKRLLIVADGTSNGGLDQCRELSILVNARPFAALESNAPQRELGLFRIESSFNEAAFQGLDKPFAEFAVRACEQTWKLSSAQVEELKKLFVIYADLAQEHAAKTDASAPTPASTSGPSAANVTP